MYQVAILVWYLWQPHLFKIIPHVKKEHCIRIAYIWLSVGWSVENSSVCTWLMYERYVYGKTTFYFVGSVLNECLHYTDMRCFFIAVYKNLIVFVLLLFFSLCLQKSYGAKSQDVFKIHFFKENKPQKQKYIFLTCYPSFYEA